VLHISLEMSLSQTLLELSRRHTAALSPRERADIEDELDRLRMMRVAEDGLAAGDPLPDFSLEDGAGRVWTSGELLDRGPLVLALFRGGWCPYCDLTMLALEDARAAIEALGATAVGVMPGGREVVASAAAKRAIRFPLLADPANGFARMCGLTYELSPAHIRIHKDRGRDFRTLHREPVWHLPVPAVFVVEPSARVAWAFSDVDPARWPDPQELLASLEALRNAHTLSNR
jgi:peroxiredoxin